MRRALAYRYDQIPYKFMASWDVTQREATDLFTETKRLLWVIAVTKERGYRFEIDPPLTILDEMWHTFVLFTREYAAYCERVFGYFIHHSPTTARDDEATRAAMKRDPAGFARRETERCVRQWELIRDVAGEPTLLKWYVELPRRYGARFFQRSAIPIAMPYRPPEALVRLVDRRRAG